MNQFILTGIQAVGIAVTTILAILMFPQLLRKDRAATAKDVEEVAKSSEERDAKRELREAEREKREADRFEQLRLNVEIMTAFIVYDEDWHFHEARLAAAEGRPVRERLTFDQYGRRYRKDWFIDRLDQVITQREDHDDEAGGRHGE